MVLILIGITQARAYDFVADGYGYNINPDGKTVTMVDFVGNPDTLKCLVIPDVVVYDDDTYLVEELFNFNQDLSGINLDEIYVGRNLRYMNLDQFPDGITVKRVVWNARNCEYIYYITDAPANSAPRHSSWDDDHRGFGEIMTDRLEEVIIGDEVRTLPHDFVQGSKIKSLHIPASLTDFNPCYFYRCEDLRTITVDAANPLFDSRDNCNGVVRKSDNTLVMACAATRIPASVKTIGRYIYCTSNVKSLVIPSTISKIESYAFWDFKNLERIDCHIANPADVELGWSVFEDLLMDGYEGVPANTCVLHVPKGSASLYRNADQWKRFNNIVEGDFMNDCPLLREGVKWVCFETKYAEDCGYYEECDLFYAIEVKGDSIVDGTTYKKCYRYPLSEWEKPFIKSSTKEPIALLREEGTKVYIISSKDNSFYEGQDYYWYPIWKNMLEGQDGILYDFSDSDHFDPLGETEVEGRICKTYEFTGGYMEGVFVEGIGYDSQEDGDLLLPGYLGPFTVGYTYSCIGLHHVEDAAGNIIYKGANYGKYARRDMNGDRKLDVEDVNAVINLILETADPSQYETSGDANSDGKVDVEDVNAAINFILGVNKP